MVTRILTPAIRSVRRSRSLGRLLGLAALLWAALAAAPAAAQDLYRIQPGDVLRIEVIEDNSLNRSLLVAPDGRITFPLAGSVQAGGRSVEAVTNSLTQRLAPNFAVEPTVFVSLDQIAPAPDVPPAAAPVPVPDPTIRLFVIGEASTPGPVDVPPGTTVLEAISQIGGFTPYAATRRVQLRRRGADGQETIYTLDYEAILDGRSPNGTATLIDGDVLVIPERRLFE